MNGRLRHRLKGWRRAASLAGLLVFVLGSQHCALMGLAGRSCDAAPRWSAAGHAAPAVHPCCAGAARARSARHAATDDASCCLKPAPLPVAAELATPSVTHALAFVLSLAPLAAPATAIRAGAPPPESGSPPGEPLPESILGRAPPLA